MYRVTIKKSILKNIHKMPREIQFTFEALVNDLKEKGPIFNDRGILCRQS